MRKFILPLCAIALSTCAICMTACGDDESSCECIETDYDGYSATRTLDPKSYGATNCSDLEVKLKMASYGEYDYNCH